MKQRLVLVPILATAFAVLPGETWGSRVASHMTLRNLRVVREGAVLQNGENEDHQVGDTSVAVDGSALLQEGSGSGVNASSVAIGQAVGAKAIAVEREALVAVAEQQKALVALESQEEAVMAQQTIMAQQMEQMRMQQATLVSEMDKFMAVPKAEPSAFQAYLGGQNIMHLLVKQSTRDVITHELLTPGRQVLAIFIHLVILMIIALLYGKYFTYPYPDIVGRKPADKDSIFHQGFAYSLFEAFSMKPDFRIAFFGCCCMPVRWADTASSVKIAFMPFWPALCLFSLLYGFVALSHFVTTILFLLLVVTGRQKIRAVYGMAYGTKETVCADCVTWVCCGPCATMQEAMQVELATSQEYQNTMNSTMMSQTRVAGAQEGAPMQRPGEAGAAGQDDGPFATGQRKQKTGCC